ncbi:hypothetical protein O181_046999 [Austropuccinia psidii MF-1]|uniref:Uncharacterized protein n=1 Tax=Austropuccinia psidii MF-1 TaxID=1389203 RepID=A0A9Q3DQ70_9BASI|nr:hypothetical protein [Austropuccinia psidii MF-1]
MLVTTVVQQTTMTKTFQRQRKKPMPLRKSQRSNPLQRILTQTLWVMPSENNLMITKTQKRIPSGIPRGTPTRNPGNTVGSRHATRYCRQNLCKHTQDAQTFLVTPTKGMAYIHGKARKMTVCIDNAQHPRNYLDNHFPNLENQPLPTKAKNFKRASGKMTSIGTIIKEIVILH